MTSGTPREDWGKALMAVLEDSSGNLIRGRMLKALTRPFYPSKPPLCPPSRSAEQSVSSKGVWKQLRLSASFLSNQGLLVRPVACHGLQAVPQFPGVV